MKKISILFLVIVLVFSGCKSQKTSSDTTFVDSETSSFTSASTIPETENADLNNESSSKEQGSKTESSSKTQNSSSNNGSSISIPTYQNPTSDGEVEEDEMNMIKAEINAVSPTLYEKVTLANDKVLEFTKNYTVKSSKKYYGSGDIYKPNAVEFKWTCDKKTNLYIFAISTDKNLNNADEYTAPNTGSFSLYNLYAGKTYYWQVTAKFDNGIAKSKVFTFETAQTVRTINIAGVSNTRDIGGYLTESGKRVKQGMIYRAASLDGISIAGKDAALNKYKIKTDLDIRGNNEGTSGKGSPIDTSLNYIHSPGTHYKAGISNKNNWANLVKSFEALGNPKNYPIIVHCSVGRDRTGTICLLLNGLLGVSKEDLIFDYELSFLSESGCRDNAPVGDMVAKIESTYNYIASYGGNDGKPFSAHVEKYLLDIGVSQKTIDSIKSNMLE